MTATTPVSTPFNAQTTAAVHVLSCVAARRK